MRSGSTDFEMDWDPQFFTCSLKLWGKSFQMSYWEGAGVNIVLLTTLTCCLDAHSWIGSKKSVSWWLIKGLSRGIRWDKKIRRRGGQMVRYWQGDIMIWGIDTVDDTGRNGPQHMAASTPPVSFSWKHWIWQKILWINFRYCHGCLGLVCGYWLWFQTFPKIDLRVRWDKVVMGP